MTQKQNLLNLNQADLSEFFAKLGEKPFRTKQLMKWIYKDHVFDFDQMLNLSKKLRETLSEVACIDFPEVVSKNHALDGVVKWVIEMGSDNHIEMVYIPEKDRGTLCISSQVGCALACTFCSTGYQGFNRNLSTAEIMA
ncbi:MAG: bifunctional tRNA (adenosine(37)-C2)-methyltransferase TrmG/ribosomal RNA large subunit methyltransferase RlmN, partial [Candidatus Thioglobus sp.]